MLSKLMRLAPYSIYPLLLAISYSVYFVILNATNKHLLSIGLGILPSAILVLIIEEFKPLHLHWKATFKDLAEDIFFYTLFIQVCFPLLLYFLVKNIFIQLGFENGVLVSLWPNSWVMGFQFLLLTVSAEFFQYWWHRLCHSSVLFWPVHAVHHMPLKLYSMNTARFHFLDKLVEFSFTMLLFLALGTSIEVISYYYIFFAITGFIQHANIDVRLGWFDYIIASGETHRFHHDIDPKKSKCNYANNLVIWDLIFGSFLRNLENPIKIVGMRGDGLPKNINDEIKYPIVKIFTKSNFLKIKFKLILTTINLLIPFKMHGFSYRLYFFFKVALKNPLKAQNKVLLSIVSENKETMFGKEHSFKDIATVRDFKAKVPIGDYEQLRGYFEKVFSGEKKVLTLEEPYYFTKTSGTTGKPKYLPVTNKVQQSYLDAQQILTYAIYLNRPASFKGLIYTVTGSHIEEVLQEQWPAGSMSGKLMLLLPKFLKLKYTNSEELSNLTDYNTKYLYLAATALLTPEVTLYGSPNPATLIKILEVINLKKNQLIDLLRVDDKLLERYSFNREWAMKLLKKEKPLQISDIWPHLECIVIWTGGSCGFLIPQIKSSAKNKVSIIDLGYLSSEFYGTVTFDAANNLQLPTLLDNFFEFIEKSDYENGIRETVLLNELKVGTEYYVIVTTKGGLYRYFMNDLVKVSVFLESTPVLKFVQKGKGITNIMGEKLSEFQISSFFERTQNTDTHIHFFICLANPLEQNYTLYIEPVDGNINLNLQALSLKLKQHLFDMNIEYKEKVKSHRLSHMKVSLLKKGTAEKYKNQCLNSGQRESQFKFLHVQYSTDIEFSFSEHEIKNYAD
jgi:sterol desaturase/sphingolipid hydroxylase (fatty acid hydroxylase superfamily)